MSSRSTDVTSLLLSLAAALAMSAVCVGSAITPAAAATATTVVA